ncbi:relaxase/mobilization nuclease domain-containing protein [Anaerosphaera multitolerans]|uniref:Endonuclease n=1 Tax=Anaerosphaera multitolerans TaxID=2487351 RepID=A0A437S9D3_9FIRM|nr:relaxase/mobilization nuclease domain-containing protein [Anaerosphaera multitolerans]RVU55437.1 endonuclease [Anaerosphaera multitolerans]
MAVTKIHPIKTTLKYALDYIMDESKTDEQILISAYGCGHETAYLEFQMTKERWNSSAKNLARHLIQSFDPDDDITPEVAHEIGIKFANKILKNHYEYVLTTHIDKGHIHNYILFNNVSFEDGKSYISNKKTYKQIRNISDELCREYGLHVIEEESKEKGKSYKEHMEKNKGTSWKAQLKYAIDSAIKKSKNWDSFLQIMQEMGYEIKEGKHVSFRAKDQQRFTRSKTIGDYYTEESIRERINNRNEFREKNTNSLHPVDRIIDMKNNEKVKNFKGYEFWAKQHNLKNISKTLTIMNQYGIKNIENLYCSIKEESKKISLKSQEIKTIESKINEISLQIKNIEIIEKYEELYSNYQTSQEKAQFYQAHSDGIILYESAVTSMEDNLKINKPMDISTLNNELDRLKNMKKIEVGKLKTQKNKVSELNLLKSNLETYMKSKKPIIENKKEH